MDLASIRDALTQPSVIVLLLSNAVPLVGVLFFGWDQALLLLLYWLESAVIGVFSLLKLWGVGGAPAKPLFDSGHLKWLGQFAVVVVKLLATVFFTFHFGIFMLVHFFFILAFLPEAPNWGELYVNLGVGLAGMIVSHGLSYKWNYVDKKEYSRVGGGDLMGGPYARIFVMQLAIILGFMLSLPAVILVLGKTVLDLNAHVMEHRRMAAKT
ncbi:hypothetical protein HYV43_06530 [Candidatus Micrarchaeota archaeon]|nr:hypothetical protein [Candidatus Micrarchaeota archaeon]